MASGLMTSNEVSQTHGEQTGQLYLKPRCHATVTELNHTVKLTAYLFLRALNSGHKFYLAANVAGAGAFDDIVINYQVNSSLWSTSYVQLRHEAKVELNSNKFIVSSEDFSLKKYFKSFREIKENVESSTNTSILFRGPLENCRFILYTCANVDKDEEERLETRAKCMGDCVDEAIETLFQTECKENEVFTFHEEVDADVYSAFPEDNATKFLHRFKVFYGQPTESFLDENIIRELRVKLKLTYDEAEQLNLLYIEEFKDWWLNKSYMLQDTDPLVDEVYSRYFVSRLSLKFRMDFRSELKFKYTDKLRMRLSGDCNLLNIIYDGRLKGHLGCYRVLQVLESINKTVIFLDMKTLLLHHDKVVPAWSTGRKHCLVVIENDFPYNPYEIEEIIYVLLENRNKQFVLLSNSKYSWSLFKYMGLGNWPEIFYDQFTFTHLEEDYLSLCLPDMKKYVLLFEHSKELCAEFVNLQNKDGLNAMHRAKEIQDEEMERFLIHHGRIVMQSIESEDLKKIDDDEEGDKGASDVQAVLLNESFDATSFGSGSMVFNPRFGRLSGTLDSTEEVSSEHYHSVNDAALNVIERIRCDEIVGFPDVPHREREVSGTYIQKSNAPKSRVLYNKHSDGGIMERELYEIKLAALLFVRALNTGHRFCLATNVLDAGFFDDIVFGYELNDSLWSTYCIRVKHTNKNIKLRLHKLNVPSTLKSWDKFYRSYCTVKQNVSGHQSTSILFQGSFENCRFVLYTSAQLDEIEKVKLVERKKRKRDNVDDAIEAILKTDAEADDIFNFQEDVDGDMYSSFAEQVDGRDFLKQFKVFCGQPTQSSLNEFIVRELMLKFGVTHDEAGLLSLLYIEKFQNWWNNESYILQETDPLLDKVYNSYLTSILPSQLKHTAQIMDETQNVFAKSKIVPYEYFRREHLLLKSDLTVRGISEIPEQVTHIDKSTEPTLDYQDISADIISASSSNNICAVQTIVESGGDVNKVDLYGNNAITLAAEKGFADIVEFLIDHGGDVTVTNKLLQTPLMMASREGHLSVVNVLISSLGDHTSSAKQYVNQDDDNGDSAMILAAGKGFADIVKILIDHGGDITVTNKMLETPLMMASHKGHLSVVKMLVESLGDDTTRVIKYVNAVDMFKDSAMTLALMHGFHSTTEYLRGHCGNVEVAKRHRPNEFVFQCSSDSLSVIELAERRKSRRKGTMKSGTLVDENKGAIRFLVDEGITDTVEDMEGVGLDVKIPDEHLEHPLLTPFHGATPRAHGRPREEIYVKNPDFATVHGPMYEVKLAALMFVRALNLGKKFYLAANVVGAEGFNNIVIRYQINDLLWVTLYTRISHSKRYHLRTKNLLVSKGAFSLNTFYRSYCKVKEKVDSSQSTSILFQGSFENCRFVLHTSAQLDEIEKVKLVERKKRKRDNVDDAIEAILKTDSQADDVFNFQEDVDVDVYSSFAEQVDGKDFLQKFKVICGQPTHSSLNEFIVRELMLKFNITHDEAGLLSLLYIEKFQNWWVNKPSYMLHETDPLLDKVYNSYLTSIQSLQLKLLAESEILASNSPGSKGFSSIVEHTEKEISQVSEPETLSERSFIATPDYKGHLTELISASVSDNICDVKYIVENGGDVNGVDLNGNSAMSIAASKGFENIVKYLIEDGGDVTLTDKYLDNPLMIASRSGHLPVVKILIESFGDDTDRIRDYVNIVHTGGNSAISLASSQGFSEIVKYLIEHGGDLIMANTNLDSPLILACEYGHFPVVQILVESLRGVRTKFRYINQIGVGGHSAVSVAALKGFSEILRYLIEHGGDVTRNLPHNNSPLILACGRGNVDVVKVLLDSFNGDEIKIKDYIDKVNSFGDSAVTLATEMGFPDILELLKNGVQTHR